jgi:hypothetical protein
MPLQLVPWTEQFPHPAIWGMIRTAPERNRHLAVTAGRGWAGSSVPVPVN